MKELDLTHFSSARHFLGINADYETQAEIDYPLEGAHGAMISAW
jgi:hypothetical protein